MQHFAYLIVAALLFATGATDAQASGSGPSFTVTLPATGATAPVDGRLLLILTTGGDAEPRFQVGAGVRAAQIFGIDVRGLAPGASVTIDGRVFGYPLASLNKVVPGDYVVQALLHRYETFTLASGHTVKLPMDRGEGQQWARAPGNLYSIPVSLRLDATSGDQALTLDQVIPAIAPPADTPYIKHIRIRSELLSRFWGRDMYLGAHVLLPAGFDNHAQARYPLMINHGHFPADFSGFRPEPPDPDLTCEYSARFDEPCYNRIVQEEAHAFYKAWTGPDFPRFLIIEIQHANPYYDDSYAVNSANLGPYGDAITYELIPHIEKIFRGQGEAWSRFLYGGSTGGWEAMAAQVFYPDDYNGAFAACPDPIDFRHYMSTNIYEDTNAYYAEGPFRRVARPGSRNWLGHISATIEDDNLMELVLGTKSRSGGQFDIWEAVYSPQGDDGYPKRLWDKKTGEIDRQVAAYWRENYDLRHILERDWATLGPKLKGKLNIYVGDMDNYYLNNAVYVTEDFLEATTDPYYAGEVDYGDRAEHCWNGDQENSNAISRLRYNTMYIPKILKRIEESAPEGADLTSWRY